MFYSTLFKSSYTLAGVALASAMLNNGCLRKPQDLASSDTASLSMGLPSNRDANGNVLFDAFDVKLSATSSDQKCKVSDSDNKGDVSGKSATVSSVKAKMGCEYIVGVDLFMKSASQTILYSGKQNVKIDKQKVSMALNVNRVGGDSKNPDSLQGNLPSGDADLDVNVTIGGNSTNSQSGSNNQLQPRIQQQGQPTLVLSQFHKYESDLARFTSDFNANKGKVNIVVLLSSETCGPCRQETSFIEQNISTSKALFMKLYLNLATSAELDRTLGNPGIGDSVPQTILVRKDGSSSNVLRGFSEEAGPQILNLMSGASN